MPQEGVGGLHQEARLGQDQARTPGQEARCRRAGLILRPLVKLLRHRSLNQQLFRQKKIQKTDFLPTFREMAWGYELVTDYFLSWATFFLFLFLVEGSANNLFDSLTKKTLRFLCHLLTNQFQSYKSTCHELRIIRMTRARLLLPIKSEKLELEHISTSFAEVPDFAKLQGTTKYLPY